MVDLKKEKEPMGGIERTRVNEEFPTVESPRKNENIEAQSWMENLERRFGNTQKPKTDVNDDTTQQPQTVTQPPVTVSLTASQMQTGLKLKPEFSLAWLVVWVERNIKILLRQNRKVLFSERKK